LNYILQFPNIDVNTKDENGNTAMHLIFLNNNSTEEIYEMLEIFNKDNIYIDYKSKNGNGVKMKVELVKLNLYDKKNKKLHTENLKKMTKKTKLEEETDVSPQEKNTKETTDTNLLGSFYSTTSEKKRKSFKIFENKNEEKINFDQILNDSKEEKMNEIEKARIKNEFKLIKEFKLPDNFKTKIVETTNINNDSKRLRNGTISDISSKNNFQNNLENFNENFNENIKINDENKNYNQEIDNENKGFNDENNNIKIINEENKDENKENKENNENNIKEINEENNENNIKEINEENKYTKEYIIKNHIDLIKKYSKITYTLEIILLYEQIYKFNEEKDEREKQNILNFVYKNFITPHSPFQITINERTRNKLDICYDNKTIQSFFKIIQNSFDNIFKNIFDNFMISDIWLNFIN
jgi:hypothetical protein